MSCLVSVHSRLVERQKRFCRVDDGHVLFDCNSNEEVVVRRTPDNNIRHNVPRKVARHEEVILSVRTHDGARAGLVRDVTELKQRGDDGEVHFDVDPPASDHCCVERVQTSFHLAQGLHDAGVEEDVSVAVAVERRVVRVHGALVNILQVGRVELGHFA